MELVKTDRDRDFGFHPEAELADDMEKEDELRVFVGDLARGGLAYRNGNFEMFTKIIN